MKKVKMENAKFHREKDEHYVIGAVYVRDADLIYIVSGSYIGGYNRISNHFSWRIVEPDGTLSKKLYNGYGPTDIKRVKCRIEMKVFL